MESVGSGFITIKRFARERFDLTYNILSSYAVAALMKLGYRRLPFYDFVFPYSSWGTFCIPILGIIDTDHDTTSKPIHSWC